MDLHTGTFVQWPLGAMWEQQSWLLESMEITWSTMQFLNRTTNPKYQWSSADINFDTWLNDGRPQAQQEPSEFERWLSSKQ